MDTDFREADEIAVQALEQARSLPPGTARTDALKEAGKLRAAAERLREPLVPTSGRRSKYVRERSEA